MSLPLAPCRTEQPHPCLLAHQVVIESLLTPMLCVDNNQPPRAAGLEQLARKKRRMLKGASKQEWVHRHKQTRGGTPQ